MDQFGGLDITQLLLLLLVVQNSNALSDMGPQKDPFWEHPGTLHQETDPRPMPSYA